MNTPLAHPLTRLKRVVQAMTRLSEQGLDEAALLAEAAPLMRGLVERDDWLPETLAQPHPEFYRQYTNARIIIDRGGSGRVEEKKVA